jgi:hypothetical protein
MDHSPVHAFAYIRMPDLMDHSPVHAFACSISLITPLSMASLLGAACPQIALVAEALDELWLPEVLPISGLGLSRGATKPRSAKTCHCV